MKQAAEEKAPSTDSGTGHYTSDAEDHMTLAQILRSPSTPAHNSATFSSNKSKLKKDKLLRVNIAHFASKRTNGTSKQAHKRVKSLSSLTHTAKKSAEHPLDQVKSSAMVRAEDLQSTLEVACPSFIRTLLRSHVSSGFWLGLPLSFCRSHMPKKDSLFKLKDEQDDSYEVKFMSERAALSGGWRHFSIKNKLLEDDVLVFHLIERLVFKVYIIRANDMVEVNKAHNLLDLDAHTKQNDQEAVSISCNVSKKKSRSKFLHRPNHKLRKSREDNSGKNMSLEVQEYSGVDLFAEFGNSVNFDNFKKTVDEFLIDVDPTLSEDIRRKYHKLCWSQNSLLHNDLLAGLNFKLVSGIIYETVKISDAIRDSNFSASEDEFANLDKTLKAFEGLGMNIHFLSASLNIALKSEVAIDRKKYMEAQTGRDNIEEEIKSLEEKITKLKTVSERFNSDMETLKLKIERYELKFHERITAPW